MKARLERFSVLAIVAGVGAAILAMVAMTQLPTDWGWADRLSYWGLMLAGPVWGSSLGMGEHHSFIAFGWLGLPLAMAHPLKPHAVSGVLTVVGVALWFWAGFLSIIVAGWGA